MLKRQFRPAKNEPRKSYKYELVQNIDVVEVVELVSAGGSFIRLSYMSVFQKVK